MARDLPLPLSCRTTKTLLKTTGIQKRKNKESMTEEGFKYSILASGSSGNSFYLETPKKKLLIDAGLSGKKITGLLAEIDRKPEDIDAILITHEHSAISMVWVF